MNIHKFDSNFFCRLLGVIALLVSAYFSWDDIQADRDLSKALETPVYLMWTFFIQGALAMAGYQIVRQQGSKRVVAVLVAIVAAYLSLQGTMAQRATRYQQRVNSEITNDRGYNELIKDRDRLITKIDKKDADIAEFTKQKLITLGVKPAKADKKLLKQELREVREKIANYDHGSGSTAAAPYTFWAKFWLGEDAGQKELNELADSFKFWRDALLAILLDLGGAAMFAFAARPERRREEDEIYTETNTENEGVIRPNFNSYTSSQQREMEVERVEPSLSTSQVSQPEGEPRIPTLPTDTPLSEMPRNRNGKITGFGKSTLLEHIKNMFHEEGAGPKDGHLRGQKRTAERYNAVHDVGAMAHTWLKDHGLIKVKGRYSYPEISQSDMLKKVTETYSY